MENAAETVLSLPVLERTRAPENASTAGTIPTPMDRLSLARLRRQTVDLRQRLLRPSYTNPSNDPSPLRFVRNASSPSPPSSSRSSSDGTLVDSVPPSLEWIPPLSASPDSGTRPARRWSDTQPVNVQQRQRRTNPLLLQSDDSLPRDEHSSVLEQLSAILFPETRPAPDVSTPPIYSESEDSSDESDDEEFASSPETGVASSPAQLLSSSSPSSREPRLGLYPVARESDIISWSLRRFRSFDGSSRVDTSRPGLSPTNELGLRPSNMEESNLFFRSHKDISKPEATSQKGKKDLSEPDVSPSEGRNKASESNASSNKGKGKTPIQPARILPCPVRHSQSSTPLYIPPRMVREPPNVGSSNFVLESSQTSRPTHTTVLEPPNVRRFSSEIDPLPSPRLRHTSGFEPSNEEPSSSESEPPPSPRPRHASLLEPPDDELPDLRPEPPPSPRPRDIPYVEPLPLDPRQSAAFERPNSGEFDFGMEPLPSPGPRGCPLAQNNSLRKPSNSQFDLRELWRRSNAPNSTPSTRENSFGDLNPRLKRLKQMESRPRRCRSSHPTRTPSSRRFSGSGTGRPSNPYANLPGHAIERISAHRLRFQQQELASRADLVDDQNPREPVSMSHIQSHPTIEEPPAYSHRGPWPAESPAGLEGPSAVEQPRTAGSIAAGTSAIASDSVTASEAPSPSAPASSILQVAAGTAARVSSSPPNFMNEETRPSRRWPFRHTDAYSDIGVKTSQDAPERDRSSSTALTVMEVSEGDDKPDNLAADSADEEIKRDLATVSQDRTARLLNLLEYPWTIGNRFRPLISSIALLPGYCLSITLSIVTPGRP